MSSDIPRVVYQPSPSMSRGDRKQYGGGGGGHQRRAGTAGADNGSTDTITTRPEEVHVEGVGRYGGGDEQPTGGKNNNENSEEGLDQSRSFGAASRRLAARNQAKASYRASERSTPQPPHRDEENARESQQYQHQQHYGPSQAYPPSSKGPSVSKQPQSQYQQPRPSFPSGGNQQPPQRQQMQRPPHGQGYSSNSNNASPAPHPHQRPPPIKSNSFQPTGRHPSEDHGMASSAPSTPQNVRSPLSPRSPNVSPGATSPRDYPSNNNSNGGTGSISRMVNQTVASSPASISKNPGRHMPPSKPSSSSSAPATGIAAIDPQSIQQSNTTFTHILTQLSNLNQTGKYLSAHDLLVQSTTLGQRAVLWPILKHKVETLPTFPEAGEDDGLCLLRESGRIFGPSLKRLVEMEGNVGSSEDAKSGGNINTGPSLADDVMSPMNDTTQSDHWQQGQSEEQRQGQHQDQGHQQGEGEHNYYQHQKLDSGAGQYYNNDGGYRPQQQNGNGQGRRGDDDREAFDYSRMGDAQQRNYDSQNQQQWHSDDERQYVPPSIHEANGGGRGDGSHQQWNDPSRDQGNANRFGYSERGNTSSNYQDHHRSHQGNQEPGWRQQYEEQSQYNSRPSDHHLSVHHDRDGGSHYTNYQADGGYQGQNQYQGHERGDDRHQSTQNDAHSVRSRFSKASRSMFGQTFDEEHEVNAKRRQELFEEMEHTSRILRSTTNDDVRRSHIRHLKCLREEWEQLKGLASPNKSTLETKDGHGTDRTVGERSGKSSAANTNGSSGRRASRDKKIAKKLWRGEQILLRDPNDGHGGGFPDDKSIGLKSARSMATNARSIFDDDTKSVATAPASRPMGKKTVNVVAPETLPAGFAFEARLGDHVFMATVPEGGVAKGEVFASVINDIDEGADKASVRVRTLLDMGGPKSRWRDEFLDCFTEGFCHPLICNSFFCPQVALTQIMARMQMTSLGERGITLNSRFRVNQTIWLTVGVILVHLLYAVPVIVRSPQNVTLYVLSFLPLMAMDLGLVIYFWYLVARTRKAMRDEYDIPQIHCKCGCGAEDACMAVFCSACTLAQMGRHTADYTTYRSMCCSDTGLPNHVEVKLPSDPMNEMV